MVDQGRCGVIVNVSSGESTRPALGLAAYGAAKAAINHLTSTLAVELGPHGIRVNAVAPGTTLTPTVAAELTDEYVDALTESVPLRRMCEPDDLARLVVALASDLGRAVTGQTILADNGAHLSRNRPER
jgi:NAD(P)-dependent dehydrogenase (short-subunit alcohol dehydrogenase family)